MAFLRAVCGTRVNSALISSVTETVAGTVPTMESVRRQIIQALAKEYHKERRTKATVSTWTKFKNSRLVDVDMDQEHDKALALWDQGDMEYRAKMNNGDTFRFANPPYEEELL
jgi:uncharacterized protein with PIN domain